MILQCFLMTHFDHDHLLLVALGAYDEDSESDTSNPRRPPVHASKTQEKQIRKSNENFMSDHDHVR